jgi:hypothetical protein
MEDGCVGYGKISLGRPMHKWEENIKKGKAVPLHAMEALGGR